MQSKNHMTVVVVGYDHQNTLGVIRSLGEGGFSVNAVIISNNSKCPITSSKYINQKYIISKYELISTLIEIGTSLNQKAPLIPCGDEIVAIISAEYDSLSKWFYLSSNIYIERNLMDKATMLNAAKMAGLPVPNWVVLTNNEFNQLESIHEILKFPCILKPLKLKPHTLSQYHIFTTNEELLTCMDYIASHYESLIIQEYVEKIHEYGINACRLYHCGNTIFSGVIRKNRFSQSALGSTTAGTIESDHEILYTMAQNFVESINYSGIFDVEFLFDGTQYYFVEINFRNGGYGYACTRAGRNLPSIWAAEALHLEYSNYISSPIKEIFFINESADLQNVKAGIISPIRWIVDVLRAKAHMYFNIKDPKPFFMKVVGK